MVTLRAMTDADVPDVVTLWDHAFQAMHARLDLPLSPATPVDVGRLQNRIRHLRGIDPEGSWVAEEDGAIVGLSQSLVRDGYWVLSLLATAPDFQGHGIGRELIERSLAIADRDGPGTIQASRDPAALALYTSSGFDLHPVVQAEGMVRPGSMHPDPRVHEADSDAIELVDAIDRAVRNSSRGEDIRAMMREPGLRLLLVDDRGYAVVTDDRTVTLGAVDEEAATALLETFLAGVPVDQRVRVMWLTAKQQWAIRTLVAAGVTLDVQGAVMVRGMPGLPVTYIPSGGYG